MITLRRSIFLIFNKSSYWKRLSFRSKYQKNLISYSVYPMQIRFFITSSCSENLRTAKGWKSIARDGQKEEFMPFKPPVSCEEGSEAIPHLELMNQLQNCKTVSDQIYTFSSLMSITPEDIANRKEFCESLNRVFSPFFPHFKVHLFGSSINGLGFKGCDADVSIQTIFSENKEYLYGIKNVPTLDSVIQGETSPDTVAHLPPRLLLRFVRRILRQHCSDVKEPIILIKAKISLLRFYNSKYNLFCDFSCENYASLRNTKLIRLLCLLDERFVLLAKFIRYWGKYGGFVGDIDMFNSYSFSLLVVHFLQQRNPPILPPLEEIIEKSEYLTHGDVNDDELLYKDSKKFQPSKNTETIDDLLKEYFFYFMNFDYSHMMKPLNSTIVPKVDFVPPEDNSGDIFEFSTVTIQDPFRQNFNVTQAASYKSCKRFLSALVDACSVYQDRDVWHSEADRWGVCSLFQRTISEPEMHKKWQENCIHTIKLPPQASADLVQKILEQCLLFDCSEMFFPESNKSLLLRLSCKVYNNTWQGRKYMLCKKDNEPFTDPVEQENWVSKEMLAKREETRRTLFTFMCECFQNESDLCVVLTFKESKYPPVVAIFLKEYIPSICKKILSSGVKN